MTTEAGAVASELALIPAKIAGLEDQLAETRAKSGELCRRLRLALGLSAADVARAARAARVTPALTPPTISRLETASEWRPRAFTAYAKLLTQLAGGFDA